MILIRILLVLSMICGGVSIYIGHTKVQQRIDDTKEELATARNQLNTARQNREAADDDLTAAVATLDATHKELLNNQDLISQRQEEIDGLKVDIGKHDDARRKAEQERDTIIRNNQAWFDLNTTVAEVKKWEVTLPKVESELAATEQELDIVGRDNMRLKNMILRIQPPENPPELPQGLEGTITAYDPKYEYVVMDIGGNHGVLANAMISVVRDGTLLGKVRIMRVEDDYSTGNFLLDEKQGDIIEGDKVVNLAN